MTQSATHPFPALQVLTDGAEAPEIFMGLEKALVKLNGMVMKVGYPDKWKDLSSMNVDRSSYVRNVIASNKWEMAYMANHFDKRLDPRLLVDDAKTVISLLFNYYTDQQQSDPEAPKISKYAYGEDYHYVIKDKLKELIAFIQQEIGEVNGRGFVDSAPVIDKAWANCRMNSKNSITVKAG